MSERVKLGLLCFLLVLLLGILTFTSVGTLQAVRTFQRQAIAVKRGDVSTIHPWMTIHMVSHIYHVPEDYLYRSLQISAPGQLGHTTLYQIARRHQSVKQVISTIQRAILQYRKEHPKEPPPLTPAPAPARKPAKTLFYQRPGGRYIERFLY